MSDITLTASARSSLLSLTNTASLMTRTQSRLTTGLKVSSAIDDAVSYFKSKALTDRATDFSTRKDEIDQGISSMTAAINGTSLVDGILSQMKGIVDSVRTADSSTRAALSSQFNNLAQQINSAVSDSSYQGLNLVDNSSASLTVYFNQGTSASLKVQAKNLRASKLLTTMTYGASAGNVVSDLVNAAGGTGAGFSNLTSQTSISPAAILDHIETVINKGISQIRSQSALLGGNVTFLQTRLDFTNNYINTLQQGSGKLTLADLNAEGANLVSLQTRQQIGIQSLSIAGQQQQSILSLLR